MPTLRDAGVALFAISYDSIEILSAFARKHGITFALLSDHGSRVIRQLGLVNERVQDDHAHYGIASNPRHDGLPYPGVFALDERGIIVQKRFHESYRVRDTGAGLVDQMLGGLLAIRSDEAVRGEEAVRVRVWLDSPTYAFFQRLRVNVEISVAPGFHLYGRPAPAGFVPLSVQVAPIDNVEIGRAEWPTPHRFQVKGLDEEFWVHEGTVRTSIPLTFSGSPGAGDHIVDVTVSYQACSDSACLVPASISRSLPVREVALVGRELPSRKSV